MDKNKLNKILVVDDDDLIRDILKEELESLGHNVVEANSGDAAFDLFQKTKDIDLIFSDARMPNGDGKSLLKRICDLKLEKKPVMIICTGDTDLTTNDLNNICCSGLIHKPYEMEEISSHIKKYFD